MKAHDVKQELAKLASRDQAKISTWFFKTGPGDYGEGDRFIGIKVPFMRRVAKQFHDLSLDETIKLLQSPIHEHRFVALIILCDQYKKASDSKKEEMYQRYLGNTRFINNWDLVDVSAPSIVGEFGYRTGSRIHRRLITSKDLWERRIGVIATQWFIRAGETGETQWVAKHLLDDTHDLIQKAVGWMLREAGKRNEADLLGFLDRHASTMPRTMLRYAIERLDHDQRARYMRR